MKTGSAYCTAKKNDKKIAVWLVGGWMAELLFNILLPKSTNRGTERERRRKREREEVKFIA